MKVRREVHWKPQSFVRKGEVVYALERIALKRLQCPCSNTAVRKTRIAQPVRARVKASRYRHRCPDNRVYGVRRLVIGVLSDRWLMPDQSSVEAQECIRFFVSRGVSATYAAECEPIHEDSNCTQPSGLWLLAFSVSAPLLGPAILCFF